MPDSVTLPVAEGGRTSSGGMNWPLIAGGVGAVVLVILLLNKQGSSAPATTAAGTSINAALGSIQEENLNLMGQLSQTQGALGGQIDQSQQAISSQLTQMDGDLSGQLGTINGNVTGIVHSVDSVAQAQAAMGQTLGVIQTGQQQQTSYWQTVAQQLQAQLATIMGKVNAPPAAPTTPPAIAIPTPAGPLGFGTQNIVYDPSSNSLSFTQRFQNAKQAVFNLWDETVNQNTADNSAIIGAVKGTGTGWSGAYSVFVPGQGGQFTFANVPKLIQGHQYSIRIALPNEGGGIGANNEAHFTI